MTRALAANPSREGTDRHAAGYLSGVPIAVWAVTTVASSVVAARLFGLSVGLAVFGVVVAVAVLWGLRHGSAPTVSKFAISLLIGSVLVPFSLIPPIIGGLVSADDVVFLGGVALAGLYLWQHRRSVRVPVFTWPLAALAAWALIVWLIGDRTLGALARGPVRLGLYFVIMLAAVLWFQDRSMTRFAVGTLVVVAVVEAVFAVFSYYAPFEVAGLYIGIEPIRSYDPIYQLAPGRAVGTLGLASNFLGAYMLIPAALVLGLGSRTASRRQAVAWSVVYVTLFWALAITYTRASLIAVVLAAIGYFAWTRRLRMAPAFVVALTAVMVLTPFASRFTLGNDRARLAADAIEVIKANPVTGVGAGEYVPGTPTTGPDEPVTPAPDDRRVTPHNSFLLFASELGIPGGLLALLAVLLSLLAALGGRIRTRDGLMAVAVAAGLGAFALQTMSNNLLHIPVVTIQFWLACALGAMLARRSGGRLARLLTNPHSPPA